MIYEHALPQKNTICSKCKIALKPALQGKSKLLVRTKGHATHPGSVERIDLCPDCAALEQSKRGYKSKEVSCYSKKTFVATWVWRKSKRVTTDEAPALHKKRLTALLEELFSCKEYNHNAQEEYILSLILYRGGVIKRRRGQDGSILFIWNKDSSDGVSRNSSEMIRFTTPPEELSKNIIETVSYRIMNCFKDIESDTLLH